MMTIIKCQFCNGTGECGTMLCECCEGSGKVEITRFVDCNICPYRLHVPVASGCEGICQSEITTVEECKICKGTGEIEIIKEKG